MDLVVVPSYGDKKTIQAHHRKAQAISTDFGARVFVVQQVIPEEVEASAPGYILPPDIDFDRTPVAALHSQPPGTTHPISFKRV